MKNKIRFILDNLAEDVTKERKEIKVPTRSWFNIVEGRYYCVRTDTDPEQIIETRLMSPSEVQAHGQFEMFASDETESAPDLEEAPDPAAELFPIPPPEGSADIPDGDEGPEPDFDDSDPFAEEDKPMPDTIKDAVADMQAVPLAETK